MLSTPVCGVELRKEAVAPFEAPLFRSEAATGMTEQEHSGIGTPNTLALTTDLSPGLPSQRWTNSLRIETCSSPATANPNKR